MVENTMDTVEKDELFGVMIRSCMVLFVGATRVVASSGQLRTGTPKAFSVRGWCWWR